METKARYVLIGALTIAGFAIMALFLLWFGTATQKHGLDDYDVLFTDVSGVSRGTDVRFAGLSVGQVTSLELESDGSGKVRVRLQIDARTPVRVNSIATLTAQGVTGLYAVSISAGSPGLPLLKERDSGVPVIRAGLSTLDSLTQAAPELVNTTRDILNDISTLLSEENRDHINAILANMDSATEHLDRTLAGADKALSNLDPAIEAIAKMSDVIVPLADRADALLANADGAVTDMRAVVPDAQSAIRRADALLGDAQTDLSPALADLRAAAAGLREGVDQIVAPARDVMGVWSQTGTVLTRRLDEAQSLIANLDATVQAFDADTMDRLGRAIDNLADAVPRVTADISAAARSAQDAFGTLDAIIRDLQAPLHNFGRAALPELSRLIKDLRGVVNNANGLVGSLRNDGVRALTPAPKPEFRR